MGCVWVVGGGDAFVWFELRCGFPVFFCGPLGERSAFVLWARTAGGVVGGWAGMQWAGMGYYAVWWFCAGVLPMRDDVGGRGNRESRWLGELRAEPGEKGGVKNFVLDERVPLFASPP